MCVWGGGGGLRARACMCVCVCVCVGRGVNRVVSIYGQDFELYKYLTIIISL